MPRKANPRARTDARLFQPTGGTEERYLRPNSKLIRHAAIRRIIAGRYHTDGVRSLEHLQRLLESATGIKAHIQTLAQDLREMGAIKVRDAERTTVEWWVLPAFNPNVENLRSNMDTDLIESEVGHKLATHVYDLAPYGNFVYVMTESRAGPLVAYWLSWLSWEGIIMVQEQLDSAIIHCVNDHTAIQVARRLVGNRAFEGGDEDADTEDDGDD